MPIGRAPFLNTREDSTIQISTLDIKTALNNDNLEEAERFVHSIKGVAGNIGVNKLQKIADDLAAVNPDYVLPLDEIGPLLRKLESER